MRDEKAIVKRAGRLAIALLALVTASLPAVASDDRDAHPGATAQPAPTVDDSGRSHTRLQPPQAPSAAPPGGAPPVTRAAIRRWIRSTSPADWLSRYGDVVRAERPAD